MVIARRRRRVRGVAWSRYFLSGIVLVNYVMMTVAERNMFVSSGFAEVSADRVSVLVDSAEKAVDIDLKRAEKAMVRARRRLAKDRSSEDIDFLRAESCLLRAIKELKL